MLTLPQIVRFCLKKLVCKCKIGSQTRPLEQIWERLVGWATSSGNAALIGTCFLCLYSLLLQFHVVIYYFVFNKFLYREDVLLYLTCEEMPNPAQGAQLASGKLYCLYSQSSQTLSCFISGPSTSHCINFIQFFGAPTAVQFLSLKCLSWWLSSCIIVHRNGEIKPAMPKQGYKYIGVCRWTHRYVWFHQRTRLKNIHYSSFSQCSDTGTSALHVFILRFSFSSRWPVLI